MGITKNITENPFRMAAPKLTLNSGKEIPQLGFGTWLAAPGVVGESVQTAIKCGFRHIDCAWIYGNEPEVGEAFKAAFSSVPNGKTCLSPVNSGILFTSQTMSFQL